MLKSLLFRLICYFFVLKESVYIIFPHFFQKVLLRKIIQNVSNTKFGIDKGIKSITDFNSLEVIDYENLNSYIRDISEGKCKILSNTIVKYFATTSGTTSGSKYIPLTNKALYYNKTAIIKLLAYYCTNTGSYDIINSKMIFLQGSPKLDKYGKVLSGRLSGIAYHIVSNFFISNRLPSYDINTIDDWQQKVKQISKELIQNNVSVIGGIPPWIVDLVDCVNSMTNKPTMIDHFRNLKLYIHGGVDYRPYKSKLKELMGESVSTMDTFVASEGFYAISDSPNSDDMLLLVNQGVYYEFIVKKQLLSLSHIKVNQKYTLVISTLSGLYRYNTGDIVEFTSKKPYRLRVAGRESQYLSKYGEHTIASNVEYAISRLIEVYKLKIVDFFVSTNTDYKCYEWRIEFENDIEVIDEHTRLLDIELSNKNSYYKDLIDGKIINSCKIIKMQKGEFEKARKQKDKIGGQNKVVHLGEWAES